MSEEVSFCAASGDTIDISLLEALHAEISLLEDPEMFDEELGLPSV